VVGPHFCAARRNLLVRGGGIWFYALPDTHCAICIIRIGRADFVESGIGPFLLFDSARRGYSSLGFVGSCHSPSPIIASRARLISGGGSDLSGCGFGFGVVVGFSSFPPATW